MIPELIINQPGFWRLIMCYWLCFWKKQPTVTNTIHDHCKPNNNNDFLLAIEIMERVIIKQDIIESERGELVTGLLGN